MAVTGSGGSGNPQGAWPVSWHVPCRLIALLLLLPLLDHTSEAASDSGEYAGVYVLDGPGEAITPEAKEVLQLKCFLAFTVMGPDGTGADFYLDHDLFLRNGTVSFVRVREYACKIDRLASIETCKVRSYANNKQYDGIMTYNYYPVFTPARQVGFGFSSLQALELWMSGDRSSKSGRYGLTRCNGLSGTSILSYLSGGPNRRSDADVAQRMFYGREPIEEDLALARRVRSIIGK